MVLIKKGGGTASTFIWDEQNELLYIGVNPAYIFGGDTTGDDLVLRANNVDELPLLKLFGNAGWYLYAALGGHGYIKLGDNAGARTLTFLDSDDVTIGILDSNGNLKDIAGDINSVAWTNYMPAIINGWGIAPPTANLWFKKVGNIVFVNFYINGMSNDTAVNFTLPYAAANNAFITACAGTDNGVQLSTACRVEVDAGTDIANVYKTMVTGSIWTPAGIKTVEGQFWYEAVP